MLHLQLKLTHFSFYLVPLLASQHLSEMHHPERMTVFWLSNWRLGVACLFSGGGGLLFVWFVGFSFRKFWTCTWKMGKRETSCIWTPGLQSDGHCCVVAFSDKDTVQRWRTGITPLPAASQELQLLLLICFAVGTDDFLLTAGPQRPLWPTDRPGWVCSSPF